MPLPSQATIGRTLLQSGHAGTHRAGRMPTLEIINERFARQLRIGLYNFLRRGVEISVGPVKVSKYSEFIRNLVVPTNLNLVHFKPLRGTALMIFNPIWCFSWSTIFSVATGVSIPVSKDGTSRKPSIASSSACSILCSRLIPSPGNDLPD